MDEERLNWVEIWIPCFYRVIDFNMNSVFIVIIAPEYWIYLRLWIYYNNDFLSPIYTVSAGSYVFCFIYVNLQ